MRPHRDVETLAAAQVARFLVLTYLEPNFFLVHLYESILYIAILVMLFYMRGAYMIGMLASVVWLGLGYESGVLGSAVRNVSEWGTASLTAKLVALVALTTALLAVLMVTFFGRHWMKECAGLGKERRTFLASLGIVAVYYGTLLRFFWEMIPNA